MERVLQSEHIARFECVQTRNFSDALSMADQIANNFVKSTLNVLGRRMRVIAGGYQGDLYVAMKYVWPRENERKTDAMSASLSSRLMKVMR